MKVFQYKHPGGGAAYSGISLINSYPMEDGVTLKGNSTVNNCREFFTMGMQGYINCENERATRKAYALLVSAANIPSRAVYTAKWLATIKSGITALNALERHYGIPLTKIHPVVSRDWDAKAFVIGSKRWTKSRYSFGLWTLFFRICSTGPLKPESMRLLLPKMKWPEVRQRICEAGGGGNAGQARSVFHGDRLEQFFDFERQHLKNRLKNWDPDLVNSGFQRPEGIVKLVTGNSYSPKLKRLWKEHRDDFRKKKAV